MRSARLTARQAQRARHAEWGRAINSAAAVLGVARGLVVHPAQGARDVSVPRCVDLRRGAVADLKKLDSRRRRTSNRVVLSLRRSAYWFDPLTSEYRFAGNQRVAGRIPAANRRTPRSHCSRAEYPQRRGLFMGFRDRRTSSSRPGRSGGRESRRPLIAPVVEERAATHCVASRPPPDRLGRLSDHGKDLSGSKLQSGSVTCAFCAVTRAVGLRLRDHERRWCTCCRVRSCSC